MKRLRATAIVLLLLPTMPLWADKEIRAWEFYKPACTAHFKVNYLMGGVVRGMFSGVEGRVELNEDDPVRSRIDASIDVRTLHTGDVARDAFLKNSVDFFAAQTYPAMTFKSTKFERRPDGNLLATGLLTIRGVTREVSFEVTGPSGAVPDERGVMSRGLVARTSIDRKAYGMTWQENLRGGGVALSDIVEIEIDLILKQAK